MHHNDTLNTNRDNYQRLYAKEGGFLRYPADWVIRFHNMFLRDNIPERARALDYGCGAGNNSIFLMQKGYDVYGVDVAPAFKNLVKKNMELHHQDVSALDRFKIIKPDGSGLPFPDKHFHFILSNQVLYYLPNEEHVKKVCREMDRMLHPRGYVFFTMMGMKHYYMTHHLKQVHNNTVFEARVETKGHRLEGVQEMILAVKDEDHLCRMFDTFEPVTVGYFDFKLFDLTSGFHYIFVGKKKSK